METNRTALSSISALWRDAFSFYREHFAVIVGITIAPFLFIFVISLASSFSKGILLAVSAILVVIVAIVFGFLSNMALFTAIKENGTPEGGAFGAYKRGLKLIVPLLWISALSGLAGSGGFYLFIIPGIILGLRLSLSTWIFLDEGQRGMSALVSSFQYTKGYAAQVFVKYLGLTGIVLLIMLPLFVANIFFGNNATAKTVLDLLSSLVNSVFLLPISILYSRGIYLSIKTARADSLPVSGEARVKKILIAFMVWGVICTLALITLFSFLALTGNAR